MNNDRWMRASDQDRDRIAEVLRDAYAVGRLSRDEFDERILAAYSARTLGELRDLTADLPAPPPACLPSDMVADQDIARPRTVSRYGYVRTMRACVLVLTAWLAGRMFPAAVWVLAFTVLLIVLIIPIRPR